MSNGARKIWLVVHVLGLMNVHEGVAAEYLTDVVLLRTLELNAREHSEALVGNTLLEVVVGVQVLLGGRLALLWHIDSLHGYSIDEMRQELVGIMWILRLELSSKLGLDVCNVYEVSISNEISVPPLLCENVIEHITEWLHFHAVGLVSISHEVSNESLVVGQKLEDCLHVTINSIAL